MFFLFFGFGGALGRGLQSGNRSVVRRKQRL
jgi:hypothetical protein